MTNMITDKVKEEEYGDDTAIVRDIVFRVAEYYGYVPESGTDISELILSIKEAYKLMGYRKYHGDLHCQIYKAKNNGLVEEDYYSGPFKLKLYGEYSSTLWCKNEKLKSYTHEMMSHLTNRLEYM